MKKFLKWLIPCLVACFMVVGLVQTASFTFATTEEGQTEETNVGSKIESEDEVLDENTGPDDENTTGDSGEEVSEGEAADEQQTDDEFKKEPESQNDSLQTSVLNLDSPTSSFTPKHNKKIEYLGKDLYNLTLDVEGKYSSTENKQPVDILLVLDKSGSMEETIIAYKKISYGEISQYEYETGWNGNVVAQDISGKEYDVYSYGGNYYIYLNGLTSTQIYDDGSYTFFHKSLQSKMNVLKTTLTDSINGLSTVLSKNENIDVNIAAVAYSGLKKNDLPDYKDSPHNDAEEVIDWTSLTTDKYVFDTKINSISAEGGTNPQAGFYLGKDYLKRSRNNALKYVIFLTDGVAGYYYDDDGYTTGTPDGQNTEAKRKAIDEAKSIEGLQGFYTIAFGNKADNDLCTKLINSSTASKKKTFAATDSTGIQNVFDQIAASITETTMTNVTITDTLSKYVELVTPVNDIKVIETNNQTKVQSEVQGAIVSVEGKKITATFAQNSRLEEGFTYSISYDVKVTDKAYEEYITNIGEGKDGYGNAMGDTNTDADGNETSSEKPGFYSNDLATVTYTYNNQKGSATYAKPVVQINTVDIPVTKNWIDADGKELDVKIDKVDVLLKTTISSHDYQVANATVKKDKWEGIFKNVPMNPEGTYPKYSVTDEVNGFTVYEPKVEKDNKGNYFATITNKKNPTLTITKNVTGAFGNKEGNFNITVTLQNKDGSDFVGTFYKGTENEIEFKAGVATITLGNGQSVDFNLPFGTKYKVVETTDSSTGYNVGYTIDSKDASFSDFVTLDNNDHVVVTNNKEAVPITGLIDNTPKGLGMIGTIVAEVVAIAFVLKKKKQLKM